MEAEQYLDLPYGIELLFDRDENGNEGWVASVEELPGCVSQGATPDEAVENVRDAMLGWISVSQELGKGIPLPRAQGAYSGKVLVRMAQTLHGQLIANAEKEGVSLNQFVTGVLAGSVGWRQG